ncbi:hypothetical protein SNEBB_010611 [Seison nebaliae]|nr:hypothetical protein SNEBB_010611 [Seison nebaliae]
MSSMDLRKLVAILHMGNVITDDDEMFNYWSEASLTRLQSFSYVERQDYFSLVDELTAEQVFNTMANHEDGDATIDETFDSKLDKTYEDSESVLNRSKFIGAPLPQIDKRFEMLRKKNEMKINEISAIQSPHELKKEESRKREMEENLRKREMEENIRKREMEENIRKREVKEIIQRREEDYQKRKEENFIGKKQNFQNVLKTPQHRFFGTQEQRSSNFDDSIYDFIENDNNSMKRRSTNFSSGKNNETTLADESKVENVEENNSSIPLILRVFVAGLVAIAILWLIFGPSSD